MIVEVIFDNPEIYCSRYSPVLVIQMYSIGEATSYSPGVRSYVEVAL